MKGGYAVPASDDRSVVWSKHVSELCCLVCHLKSDRKRHAVARICELENGDRMAGLVSLRTKFKWDLEGTRSEFGGFVLLDQFEWPLTLICDRRDVHSTGRKAVYQLTRNQVETLFIRIAREPHIPVPKLSHVTGGEAESILDEIQALNRLTPAEAIRRQQKMLNR